MNLLNLCTPLLYYRENSMRAIKTRYTICKHIIPAPLFKLLLWLYIISNYTFVAQFRDNALLA